MLKLVTTTDRICNVEGRNILAGRPARALHGRCLNPQEVLLLGLADETMVKVGIDRERTLGGKFQVPCRKCSECLNSRRRLWAGRARVEHRFALRTWFVTLTFGPGARSRLLWAARRRASDWGEDFDAAPVEKRFAALERNAARDLTLWLKRVRKNSGASLRYFAVSEPHEDGMPHYHILIHEVCGRVTKRQLQESWPLGFSNCKLSNDDRSVHYVAKYLAKYTASRVRASVRYGNERLAAARASLALSDIADIQRRL